MYHLEHISNLEWHLNLHIYTIVHMSSVGLKPLEWHPNLFVTAVTHW